MLFSIYSQTSKWERSKSFFGEPLKHVITIRGQILVNRTGDDLLPLVCPFKTSPCGRSKRPRVDVHHAHMLTHFCAWCRYTRRRFECTHGGVFESTHGFFPSFFSVPQHTQTHTHTPKTQHNTTTTQHHNNTTPQHHNNTTTQQHTHNTTTQQHTHNTQHNTRHHTETETERERKRERRRDKTRRQEKRREKRED